MKLKSVIVWGQRIIHEKLDPFIFASIATAKIQMLKNLCIILEFQRFSSNPHKKSRFIRQWIQKKNEKNPEQFLKFKKPDFEREKYEKKKYWLWSKNEKVY